MRDAALDRMVGRVSEKGTWEQRSEDKEGANHARAQGKSKEQMKSPE